jgi:hypothetical protein
MRKFRYVGLMMIGLGGLLIGAVLMSLAAGHQALAEDDCADQPVTAAAAQPPAQSGNPCLDCHTDEARLKDLAVEEVTESVSEGPG